MLPLLFIALSIPAGPTLPGNAPAGQAEEPAAEEWHEIRPGERVELTLGPEAPRLDGVYPSRTFHLEPGFAGRLQVWARGRGADPFLRMRRDSILRNVPAFLEDDNGGGGTTACLGTVVQPFDPIEIELGLHREGYVELVVLAAPETDATKAATLEARHRIREAQRLMAAGEFGPARDALAAALEQLEGVDEPTHSVGIASAARTAAQAATQAGALDEARRAWTILLEHDRYLLPLDHPVAVRNRETVGRSYSALGLFDDARELLEAVLAVDAQRFTADDNRVLRVRRALAEVLLLTGDAEGARDQYGRVLEALAHKYPASDPRVQDARQDLARAHAHAPDEPESKPR